MRPAVGPNVDHGHNAAADPQANVAEDRAYVVSAVE